MNNFKKHMLFSCLFITLSFAFKLAGIIELYQAFFIASMLMVLYTYRESNTQKRALRTYGFSLIFVSTVVIYAFPLIRNEPKLDSLTIKMISFIDATYVIIPILIFYLCIFYLVEEELKK